MWQDCSTVDREGCPGGGIRLHTVWHVRADPSYNVHRNGAAPRCLVAVRTLGGTGRITLDSFGSVLLARDSLLIVENQRILSYQCAARTWHFWWCEFFMFGPIFFTLHRKVSSPSSPREAATLVEIFRSLRRPSSAQRSLSSAGLSYLLHRWMAAHQDQRPLPPHQAAIERVIESMRERTDGTLSVADMARTVNLGERRFRQVFMNVTGQAPKSFYDGVRLELGRRILLAESAKISDVAERLGFSSPFHFSRAYKARFGKPPSALRV